MRKIRLTRGGEDGLRQRFVHDLNPAQAEAALAPDGSNLILAGPGSGKTRVITYRVAYLIARGIPARSILLATFTRRAAREMIGRLEPLVGPRASEVWAGTFHHLGNRLLRRREVAERLGYGPNFTILDSEDQLDLLTMAMDECGLNSAVAGRMAPKPSLVQHLLSLAFNTGTPVNVLLADRFPRLMEWSEHLDQTRAAFERRKRAANCMDYDDLLGQWSRLLNDFPDQLQAQGRLFRHLLVDEMQDTNRIQVEIIEAIARAGIGNLTAVGDDAQSIYRFRGAHYDNILKFAERNPDARTFKLEVNYRSTPEIVAFTNAVIGKNVSGYAKTLVSARTAGVVPTVVLAADAYEEADLVCQLILDEAERGIGLARQAVLYRNHHDSVLIQAALVARGIRYSVRSGLRFFEQAHIKDVLAYLRIVVNPRDEAAWRRLFLQVPGVGPVKASALAGRLVAAAEPLAALETAETMALIPTKGRGPFAAFVGDLRKVRAVDPETNPAAAIGAVLQGGYPAIVRATYERPEDRISDIEQLGVLAGRYDNLEKLISDLLLAGDVYGVETAGDDRPDPADSEVLVLSTIHQAKGLEWSHVVIPRLIEESFPNARAVGEPDGEEEERRIFYVAITRAMDQLTMIVPQSISRGGRGPTTFTRISRFLEELDPALYERAEVEAAGELGWTGGSNRPWPAPADGGTGGADS